MAEEVSKLTLPDIKPVVFKENYLKSVSCELRFPALLEYETKPPVKLQKELRKEFPNYEKQYHQALNSPSETLGNETKYVFKSRDRRWHASFKYYAIALETSAYSEFADFSSRLERLINKSRKLLDTDFFTRVGLRYINLIPMTNGERAGWINDELIAPLAKGVYGDVEKCIQEVRGYTQCGMYTFKHGMSGLSETGTPMYTLDFDFFEEGVKIDETLELVSKFNVESFRFFQWAIGPKAWVELGPGDPREAR